MIERTYEGIIPVKPEIIKIISENLDLRLFKRDSEGYSYYGCFVDPLDGAVVVVTKDSEMSTVRMIFNDNKVVFIECGEKVIMFPLNNVKGITLNQVLKEYFNVPYVSEDEEFDWNRKYNGYQWIPPKMSDTL